MGVLEPLATQVQRFGQDENASPSSSSTAEEGSYGGSWRPPGAAEPVWVKTPKSVSKRDVVQQNDLRVLLESGEGWRLEGLTSG
jgi:hypothetical protein